MVSQVEGVEDEPITDYIQYDTSNVRNTQLCQQSTLSKTGDTIDQQCGHCLRTGVDCVRSNVRFRNGLSLPEEPELAFPDQDSWPRLQGQGEIRDQC